MSIRLSSSGPAGSPTAHKATHVIGGSDALTPSDIGAQPSDVDLTAIAALTTTTFGRELLEKATAEAVRNTIGVGNASRGVKLPLNKYVHVIRPDNRTLALVLNREGAIGLELAPQTIDRLAFQVRNTHDPATVIRLGLRQDNNGIPGAPLLDVPVATGGASIEGWGSAIVDFVHPGGIVWLTWTAQAWTGTAPMIDGGSPHPGAPVIALAAATNVIGWPTGHGMAVGWQDNVSGALPSTFINAAGSGALPPTFVMRRSV